MCKSINVSDVAFHNWKLFRHSRVDVESGFLKSETMSTIQVLENRFTVYVINNTYN